MSDAPLKNVKTHLLYVSIVKTLAKDFLMEPKPPYTTYLKAVHQKMIGVLNVLHTLQIARILVAEQHPSVQGCKSKVKIADFLRYNIENYYMRITAYQDVILLLINAILEWGLEKGFNFNQQVKIRAKKEKNKDVVLIIRRVEDLLKTVRDQRNKIAHEGTFAHDVIFLEAADFMTENIPDVKISETDREVFYSKLVYDNVKEMTQIEQDLASNLLGILDLLWPVYKKKLDEIGNNSPNK